MTGSIVIWEMNDQHTCVDPHAVLQAHEAEVIIYSARILRSFLSTGLASTVRAAPRDSK